MAALREATLTLPAPRLDDIRATVFGHFPLVLVSVLVAARNSIGMVLVTGMSLGTLFSVFIVPVFYSLIAAEAQARRGIRAGRPGGTADYETENLGRSSRLVIGGTAQARAQETFWKRLGDTTSSGSWASREIQPRRRGRSRPTARRAAARWMRPRFARP